MNLIQALILFALFAAVLLSTQTFLRMPDAFATPS